MKTNLSKPRRYWGIDCKKCHAPIVLWDEDEFGSLEEIGEKFTPESPTAGLKVLCQAASCGGYLDIYRPDAAKLFETVTIARH
jgi:hypothetical protein